MADLSGYPTLAIAVSGGVDSMTLAHAAAQVTRIEAVHAVSPAVPERATARLKRHAAREGWTLRLVEAGEFADPDYLRNPVNRCFFCKTNLYRRIRAASDAPIAAGTNSDDLSDFRPGLRAAADHGVLHPFVTAGLAKADIRALARQFGLDDIAELPAQPCLASRVETGLPILAADLAFADALELAIAEAVGPGDLRCRIAAAGIRLELPSDLPESLRERATALARELCAAAGRPLAEIASYRRGSAFRHDRQP